MLLDSYKTCVRDIYILSCTLRKDRFCKATMFSRFENVIWFGRMRTLHFAFIKYILQLVKHFWLIVVRCI